MSSTDHPCKQHAVRLRCLSFFSLGTCAWSLVNAIFAQLPLILGWYGDWTLASSIALCIALSNIVPFLWSIAADVRSGRPIISTTAGIGCILALGLATALTFVLADVTAATETSAVLLLALSTMSGVVGTMSLVLFFPHAYGSARLDGGWSIASLASGTAVANLFLAIMAIIQEPGGAEPRFSMQAYFGIVVAFFGLSIVGWIGTIIYRPRPSAEVVVAENSEPNAKSQAVAPDEEEETALTKENALAPDEEEEDVETKIEKAPASEDINQKEEEEVQVNLAFWKVFIPIASDPRFREANAVQLVLNSMTFFLPGVVPWSVAYFPDNKLALHYLTVSQLVAQTIGIVITGRKRLRSERLTLQLLLAFLMWVPVVVLCVHNDLSPFHDIQQNSAVPITFNAIFNFLYGYTSTACFQVVGDRCKDRENGEHVTRVLGFLNQVGALTGSIVGYLVVTRGKIS